MSGGAYAGLRVWHLFCGAPAAIQELQVYVGIAKNSVNYFTYTHLRM